jgi:hypothetical protein
LWSFASVPATSSGRSSELAATASCCPSFIAAPFMRESVSAISFAFSRWSCSFLAWRASSSPFAPNGA